MTEKTTTPTDCLIKLPRCLVEACYSLSIIELRLVLVMIARIQEHHAFEDQLMSISELAELMAVDKNHVYAQVKRLVKAMGSRVVTIQAEGQTLHFHWLTLAEYQAGEGHIRLGFDVQLQPYVLELATDYSVYSLELLLGFKSQYTLRLYLLLKQCELLMPYEIELARLKALLALTEGQYKLYTNFRKAVLWVAQQELKENTNWYFQFEEIKYSRRVNVLRFRGVDQADKVRVGLYNKYQLQLYDSLKFYYENKIPVKLKLLDGQQIKGTVVKMISKRRKYLSINTGEKKQRVELSEIDAMYV